jgi:hypothetical protein
MSSGNSRNLRFLVFAVVAAAAVWFFATRSPDIDGQVRRQIDEVRKLVGKVPGENNLESMNKARKISELFATDFEFVAPQFDFATRDRRALVGAIHDYRSRSGTVAMLTRDVDVSVDEVARRATVHLIAEFVSGVDDLVGREAYAFQINVKEENDAWRIDYVRLLEVLE